MHLCKSAQRALRVVSQRARQFRFGANANPPLTGLIAESRAGALATPCEPCQSNSNTRMANNPMPIQWPPRYAPENAAAHVSNQIAIGAPPETVWAWLIRAPLWPTWYPNSHNVRLHSGAPILGQNTTFTWRTFGVTVRSTVREFVPNERIAWDGTAPLLNVYHAWLIEPRPAGCWVLTEETQNGLAARAQALFMPTRMHRGHDLWLARLKQQAESGPPP